MQSDKRSADERRRAAMRPTPTPEEVKEQHAERLETLSSPETPTPTQEEADAMKTGEYQAAGAQARETPETPEQREAREKRQRDMQPAEPGDPAARYTTR